MPSFTTVKTAQNLPPGRVIDIIGIVQEALSPKLTSGSSVMSTFTITDNLYSSLKVRCFRNDRSKLPVPEKGDVVVMNNVKLSEFNGRPLAVSTQNMPAPWLVYKGDPSRKSSLKAADEQDAITLSAADMAYIAELQGIEMRKKTNLENIKPVTKASLPASSSSSSSSSSPSSSSSSPASMTSAQPRHQTFSHHHHHHGQDRFTLLKNANASTFVDIICHVIKTYDDDWQDRFTLYVTDYTQNPLFYEYTEKDGNSSSNNNSTIRNRNLYDTYAANVAASRKWEGPLGKFTLQVTLWDANAYHARRYVREGSIVRLNNVNLKMTNGYLEGKVHGDRMMPEKVDVQVIKSLDVESEEDEKLARLLARKLEYWRRVRKGGVAVEEEGERERERTTVSKRKRKHDKKEEREARRRSRTGTAVEAGDVGEHGLLEEAAKRSIPQELDQCSDEKPIHKPKEKEKEKEEEKSEKPDRFSANAVIAQGEDLSITQNDNVKSPQPAAYTLNSSIKSDHPTVPQQPLSAILNRSQIRQTPRGIHYQLPFFDLQYRATVRVVDFFPSKIQDFAVRCEPAEIRPQRQHSDDGGDQDEEVDLSDSDELQGTKWTWRFGLIVQDADAEAEAEADADQPRGLTDAKHPLRMELLVADQDAERLLRMSAVDLRNDSDALAQLRSVLDVLWGNLEEVKKEKGRAYSPDECADALDSPSFTCCIKEHGVRCGEEGIDDVGGTRDGSEARPYRISGWKRVFKIFGTSITA